MFKEIDIRSTKRIEFIDVTGRIENIVYDSKIKDGICVILVPHTTAGITINENADPDVSFDIVNKINKLIPENENFHHLEGNSDAHIKSSIFGVTLNLIIDEGRITLGTWQNVYFCEFDGPRNRKIYIKIIKSSNDSF
ncbi:MAG: secondary thiamine-phosphate synthase enzyme YjbQ [Actinobacteria bacterium]|nr:secondary thiamine-phosphate synthase enzyme YjbQ [Actinomycetota bacterium]